MAAGYSSGVVRAVYGAGGKCLRIRARHGRRPRDVRASGHADLGANERETGAGARLRVASGVAAVVVCCSGDVAHHCGFGRSTSGYVLGIL